MISLLHCKQEWWDYFTATKSQKTGTVTPIARGHSLSLSIRVMEATFVVQASLYRALYSPASKLASQQAPCKPCIKKSRSRGHWPTTGPGLALLSAFSPSPRLQRQRQAGLAAVASRCQCTFTLNFFRRRKKARVSNDDDSAREREIRGHKLAVRYWWGGVILFGESAFERNLGLWHLFGPKLNERYKGRLKAPSSLIIAHFTFLFLYVMHFKSEHMKNVKSSHFGKKHLAIYLTNSNHHRKWFVFHNKQNCIVQK